MRDDRAITVLVADDTDTDRLILEAIVRKEGHNVISARDGREAVKEFKQHRPDIVLLDALMPHLDGFEAARQIKALAGEELIPIIFLTSLTDTPSLVKCLEAGGDDFLSKPYNRVILQAKIRAFYRMRTMNRTMLEQRDQIARHNEHFLQEQTVAKQVFDNITSGGQLNSACLRYFMSPLAVFNGDVMVAATTPAGNLMVLLGDFTGHGLPAAIGAMPLATTFYGMVSKGFSMSDILAEINGKLKSILPVGLFCCATMVEVNYRKNTARIWNGGLPAAYIYRLGGSIEQVKSNHLPLGVLNNKDFKADAALFQLHHGERLYLWSDGIHEARNSDDEMFGEERILAAFARNESRQCMFDELLAKVKSFVGEGEKSDDLSLIELVMAPSQLEYSESSQPSQDQSRLAEWSLVFEVKPSSFAIFDPLPLLLSVLLEVPGLRNHSGTLYTVISELYSNALEHGVLQLDSTMKADPDGFDHYYQLRKTRTEQISEGYIRITLAHQTFAEGGCLQITVEDSGPGFDLDGLEVDEVNDYSGRGLKLVKSLCDSLEYQEPGNSVCATYRWHVDD
ncbi:fused response regulator/phosphatase [Gilvimarinus sp. DA14]|uniref:ATP-binding SpoIIE family protein phosphatase n=1 Tax=Gilvimarinus sp. DA14 TaxID=2956798 RepID=UPI0020B8F0BF|nr:fused response regulator/phosphatase [Gilvimarinus sp. DA14]UTF60790.1 fused response regulator/phosphatase [Gilvimarinus sp. DA14]